jgi:hypothetical protein
MHDAMDGSNPAFRGIMHEYTALLIVPTPHCKLRSSLAKILVCSLAWVKVGSLQDIAVKDEGVKTLQKRDLQY